MKKNKSKLPINYLRKMIFSCLVLFSIGFPVVLKAQIPLGVEVNIFPPYPTQYNVWLADASNYMITIYNNSDTEFDFYVRAGIEGNAGGEETYVRLSRDFFPSSPLTIGPFATRVLTSSDLEFLYGEVSFADLDKTPNISDDIDGELPEGVYQLCFEVMAYDRNQEIFLSPKLCSEPFEVGHNSLQLVYPVDESVWDAVAVPVTFQWMNNSSNNLKGDFEYQLEIFKIDPNIIDNESVYEYVETGGAPPFYVTEFSPDLSFVYDADFGLPVFEEGQLYAARVQVQDMGGAFFDGENYSNVNTFWFGFNPYADEDGDESDEELDCFERCEIPLPANTTPMDDLTSVTSFTMGHFLISEVELSDQTPGIQSISGTGEVTLEFMNNLRLEVAFSGVTLNTEGQALNGVVNGLVEEPNRNIVDIVGDIVNNFQPLDQATLASLSDVCSNLLTVNKILNGDKVNLPFGLGQEIGGQAFTFALVNFEATTDNANMDFVNIFDFSSLGEGFMMGLGASDVCVSPDGFGNQYKIHLIEDATLPLDGGLNVTFKGGNISENAAYDLQNNQSPCYIEVACEGFKAVNLSGIVSFPETMLKKEVDGIVMEGEKAKGYFSTTYERDFSELSVTLDPLPRTDFIMDMTIDDFQLTKLPGWGFTVENASLDLSETRNPQYLEFPEGYETNYSVDDEWKGFYIKDATLRTPPDFSNDGVPGTGAINHIIIDNALSLDIEARGLLPIERGQFLGWGLGIDTFDLKILQNEFQHGHLDGKFAAPVFDEGEHLDFYTIIDIIESDDQSNSYQMDAWVQPNSNLDIPMAIANASVCQASYLAAKITPVEEDRLIEVFLKGDLDINTGNVGTTITGNAYMELADYQLHYNSVDGFVMPEELNDGRGSYFGFENNEAIDCSDLDYTSLQDAFDYMMERMVENGENVFRTIAEETDLDVEEDGGGTFRDGEEMNGLPIRFKKSRLLVNDGAPQLNLIVEAQLSPESLIEAGIIITSEKIMDNNKFRFGVDNVELYYTEGSISLDGPVDGSSLATNENVNINWTANFQDEAIRNRLVYDLQVIEMTDTTNVDELDSLFRNSDTYFHAASGISGSEFTLELSTLSTSFSNGKQYAFRLQATDPEGETLNNDGYTNINVVTWGQTAIVGTNQGNNSECAERCSPALPVNPTPHPNPTSVSEFTMGNFVIEVNGIPTSSGNLISGQGVAKFDGFLNDVRISVTFTDVALNSEGQAMAGSVTGNDADANLISSVADYMAGNTSSDVIQSLYQFLDEAQMVTQVMTSGEVSLPFGVNVNMATSDGTATNQVIVSFTDFALTPTTSDIDFLFMLSLPSLGEGFNFGLGAQDVCIGPDGFGSEARLYLPDDLDIPLDGDVSLQFNGGIDPIINGSNTIDPFYLEIDCNGFKALNISGSAEFPRAMIVKEDPVNRQIIPNENVRGYFGMNLQVSQGDAYVSSPGPARTDLLLTFTMDPFQIKGLEGWGFEVTEAALDLSEAINYAGMEFPENYDFDDLPNQELWTGFYLKELKFKPPASYTDQGTGIDYNISNLLIDPQFSAVFNAENLLSYENGSIKGWGMSIDSFGLSILQNTFASGGMTGMMGAPVLADEDRLLYRAMIDQQVQEDDEDAPYLFRAVVRPPEDGIQIPMLVADATICGSSYIGIQLGTGEDDTQMELFLKSTLSVDFDNAPGIDIPGDFKLALADFQVQYNTVNGFVMESEAGDGKGTTIGLGLGMEDVCNTEPYFPDFNAMVDDYMTSGGGNTDRDVAGGGLEQTSGGSGEDGIGEGSDPLDNAMNGFPIRLGDFDLSLENGTPAVSFTVDLALASGGQGFAAGTGLTIYTGKETNNGKDKIVFDHVGFDCARLAVDLDFLELLGCLCYENREIEGGTSEGYAGRVMINAMDQVFVDLQAGFFTYKVPGETNFGTEDFHAFWYVDGTFASNNGIPMGPLRLNALGGGIYWNMDPPPLPGHDDIAGDDGGEPGGAQMVNDCIADLAETYNIDMPNGGQPLDAAPSHNPGTYPNGTYSLRTIKLNAGLSFADPKLVILDPLVSVTWAANQGINEITVGGYLYFLQNDYFSRGAPSSPPRENTAGGNSESLEFDARQAGDGGGSGDGDMSADGSKLWLAAFNTLYFDRFSDPGKTLVAFRGTGSLYMNIIPGVLKGNAAPDTDPYRVISHDIFIGSTRHEQARDRGYATAGGGDTYWHAYLGNPYPDVHPPLGRGAIVFDLAGAAGGEGAEQPTGEAAGLEITAYMMMGHGIPNKLPDPPQFIVDIIDGRVSSESANEDAEGSGYEGESVSLESGAREELNDKSSGFALGMSVGVNCNFEKIIYANLQVVLGMDLLFRNVAGQQCISPDGDLYSPPGVSNFYGMGQIFAGIKGAVGVRGKILGKEIDVEFLSLAAAMLIQAGGPNPFWVDGKAAVHYRVLGGLIKGDARVEVEVGDICYPYSAEPFSLDVLAKVYPKSDNVNENAMNPYHHPKATFKMPVTTIGNEEVASMYIPEISPNGNTHIRQVAPILEHFRLSRGHNSISSNETMGEVRFSNSRRSARFIPNDVLADTDNPNASPRNYRLSIRIKAREKIYNSYWSEISGFSQDTIVDFQVAPLPPYEEYVTHSNPIRGQRFFMDDEWNGITRNTNGYVSLSPSNRGMIKFYHNVQDERFYEEDDYGTYSYHVVWKDADTGEEESRYQLQPLNFDNKKITFPIPDLETSTTYIVQLVRRKETTSSLPFLSGGFVLESGKRGVSNNVTALYDVESEYAIEYPEDENNEYLEVENDETLIHHVVFRTSAYNTLGDKLQNVTVDVTPRGTVCENYCLNTDQLSISRPDQEAWEEIEFLGYDHVLNHGSGTTSTHHHPPRILVYDQMEGAYFDDDVKPMMNGLVNKIRQKIDGHDVGLRIPFINSIVRFNFNPTEYYYLNHSEYNNGSNNTYANSTVRLSNFSEYNSYFASPIQQSSGFSFINFVQFIGFLNINSGQLSSDVTLSSNVRTKVREDIYDLVDWTEPKLDLIIHGGSLNQTLSPGTIENNFGDVIDEYNNLVNSCLYNGPGNDFDDFEEANAGFISFIPSCGFFYNPFGSYFSSDIRFYYNKASVDKNTPWWENILTTYGSSVSKVADD